MGPHVSRLSVRYYSPRNLESPTRPRPPSRRPYPDPTPNLSGPRSGLLSVRNLGVCGCRLGTIKMRKYSTGDFEKKG